MTGKEVYVDVDGRAVRLTTLDRVLWPSVGFTKREMLSYYAAIAPFMIRHLARRPVTLKRYPSGVDASYWFQVDCPDPPEWVATHEVPAAGDERIFKQCLIENTAALLWAANLGTIEFQPALWTVDHPNDASFVVFDLDPGEGMGVLDCSAVALDLRALLHEQGMEPFAKTSGRKGMHLYLPLPPGTTFAEAQSIARGAAAVMAAKHPQRIVDTVSIAERRGRVLIDWRQTARLRQLCCPYSLRAGGAPTVSMPVTWDEVEAAINSGDERSLFFSPAEALDRVEDVGDIFKPAITT